MVVVVGILLGKDDAAVGLLPLNLLHMRVHVEQREDLVMVVRINTHHLSSHQALPDHQDGNEAAALNFHL